MSNSIKSNFLYNLTYQILILIIPLITTPYLSRILGSEGIGNYAYAYSCAYYFVIFAHLGLNNYGNRSIASIRDNKARLNNTIWEIYFLQLFTSILSIVLYIFVVIFVFKSPMSWIMSFYVLSALFDINWIFFGLENFKLTVIRNTVIKVLATTLIFILVKSSTDLYIYGMIMSISFLISELALWPYLLKKVPFKIPEVDKIIKHFKPNIVLFIPIIAVSLYKYMDKIMLGAMTTVSQVGYYESVERIMNVPIAVITALGTVMLPQMSNLISKGRNEQAKRYLNNSINFAMFVSCALCFGIMGVSDIFVPLFYGNGFEACISLFNILMPSCIFVAFSNVIRTQYVIPNGQDKIFIISVSCGALCNLIINFLLIPQYQANGAAIGTLCAEVAVWGVQLIAVRKDLKVKRFLIKTIPFLISGGLMYFVLVNISIQDTSVVGLFYKIIIGIIIYLSCIVLQASLLASLGDDSLVILLKQIIKK